MGHRSAAAALAAVVRGHRGVDVDRAPPSGRP
jgi:hypothetical protein